MNLLTVKEVAPMLNVKAATIYDWASKLLIPHYKINGALRFNEEEIRVWLASFKRGGYTEDAGRRPRKGGQL